jgi:hypothetical protein
MKRTGEVHGLASVNRAQDLVFVLGLNTRRDVWPIIHMGQTPTNWIYLERDCIWKIVAEYLSSPYLSEDGNDVDTILTGFSPGLILDFDHRKLNLLVKRGRL